MAAGLIAQAFAAEPHVPVKWPVAWCEPDVVVSASPAPATSNSDSLTRIPFSASIVPFSAAVIVSLTPEYRPVIECAIYPGHETGFERVAVDAVSDMVFSAPRAVNTAGPDGRYLVRVSTLFGVSWVDPPPKLPILPVCDGRGLGWFNGLPSAPRPASRVPPQYPVQALEEEIEGDVTVVLDIFSNGDAIPVCLGDAAPPGWFETAALSAVSQWRFEPGLERGSYVVKVKFRMED